MTLPGLMTAEGLERLGDEYKFAELWDGRLRVGEPAAFFGGLVGSRISAAVMLHAQPSRVGWVTDACTGFIVRRGPDRVLTPDVAFVRRERMPVVAARGFASLAPDLVAEVRSPRNTWTAMHQRGGIWIGHGVEVVWLVDPMSRRAVTMRQDREPEEIDETGALRGEPVLDGLSIPLAGLFEGIERPGADGEA